MGLTLLRTTLMIAAALLSATGIAGSAQAARTAEMPYAGKWKLNDAKTVAERTLSFAETSSGEMQMTYLGQSYTFRADGKEYPAIQGLTAAWKQIDANTWEAVYQRNGKPWATDATRLSPDGQTLTINSKGVTPAGETYDQTTVYERLSGGSGLVGNWKPKTFRTTMSAPVLELVPSGDGLTVKFSADRTTCDAKFDGRDYPCLGPTLPPGATLSIQKTGPRSFEWTRKLNGKPISRSSFSVSDDGQTLTMIGGPIAASEKTKTVFDRVERQAGGANR